MSGRCRHGWLYILLASALLSCAPGPGRDAHFKRGVEAYAREEYRRALDDLLPLAQTGHAPSQYYVGRLYALGEGPFEQDFDVAVGWYMKAADQEYAEAQYTLGRLHRFGAGLPKDPIEAGGWLRRAAENGHSRAQYELAQMLLEGRGMPPDIVLAASWLITALNGLEADGQAAATADLEKLGEILSSAELGLAQTLARTRRPGRSPQ